jgi:outer membrane protein TolC
MHRGIEPRIPIRRAAFPRTAALLLAAAAMPMGAAFAQEAPAREAPATLTLEEAIALARRSNPNFLAQANDESAADWQVRQAWGALLPSATASMGFDYQAAGVARLGILTGSDLGLGQTPAYYSSGYTLGLGYEIGAASLFRVGEARAARRSAEARTEAAAFALRAEVTRQYLAARRARDGIELARRELKSAAENLALAEARVRVGAAPPLEAKQAEVEHGRAEVALLQAESDAEAEVFRLMELLGVELDREIELTSEFEIFEPRWTLEELTAMAATSHPGLRAMRAAEEASRAAVRGAKSAYLPTIRVSAGWSGFTRKAGDPDYLLAQARRSAQSSIESCELMNRISAGLSSPLPDRPADCAALALTPADEAAILAGNDVFPFDFTRQPFTAGISVSLPVFQGFARRLRVETAQVAADDARHARRAEELRRRTEVATALRALQTAYRTVGLEQRNAAAAEEQWRLARERYRVGAGSFLELTQAEAQWTRANRDALAAVYAFHEALAALESAVGQPLRPGSGGS